MNVVIIGGSGHIGTYLVPRLVAAGHTVTNVARGERKAYQPHPAWNAVQQVVADRDAEDREGKFTGRIRNLQPDIVIDLICFSLDSARQLVNALAGNVQHLLHCGTIWVHGPAVTVPITEDQPRRPFGAYGIQKAAIETYLLNESRRRRFPATILHPGHIVGPGWLPINPAGNLNPQVFARLARGEELVLPNFGLETLHHVHADDVAQAFMHAIALRSVAIGESFHVVSPAALTLRGYAEGVAAWFGQSAQLRFLPWDDWKTMVPAPEAEATWEHISRSPCCSIAKAERLLNYRPRYSSLQAIHEAVKWLGENNILQDIPLAPLPT